MSPTKAKTPAWRRYLRFWGADPERDVDDELAFHIQARVDEYIAAGMDPARARAEADARFGSMAQARERTVAVDAQWTRERSLLDRVHALASDLRHAGRRLRRAPSLTLAAVLCFALGIGANTSIFSVVDTVLFRPLPFADPSRLVILGEQLPAFASENFGTISPPEYLDYRTLNGRVFAGSGMFDNGSFVLTGDAGPERVLGAQLSASMFDVLGVRAAHGRTFLPNEDDLSAANVVVLSYSLWQRRFSGDSTVVNRSMTIGGDSYRIVGIMPPGFAFPLPGISSGVAELFVPYRITPAVEKQRGNVYNTVLIARLADGVTLARAKSAVAEVARRLPTLHPGVYGPSQATLADLFPLHDRAVGSVRRSLIVLLAAVGFVLLIACINVSSLLVARAAARQHELALRRALGASRGRVLREFAAESVLLVAIGTTLGVVLAVWGVRVLGAAAPQQLLQGYAVSVDGRVLLFTAAIAAVTSLAVSLAPSLQSRDGTLDAMLREEGRGTIGATHQRGRRLLVTTQIALAVVVAAGAGLMIKSFVNTRNVDPGFEPAHLLSFRLAVPDYRYRTPAEVEAFERDMVERLRRMPGVRSAAAATSAPMAGTWHITATPEGVAIDKTPVVLNTLVYPGYFEALGLRMRAGAGFTGRENRDSPRVVIINEAFAHKFYSGVNPIGRRLKWGSRTSSNPWETIVGVAANVRQIALDEPTDPAVYMPALQQDTAFVATVLRDLTYVVRTERDPSAMFDAIRRAVREEDPQIPVVKLQTMDDVAALSVAGRRFNTMLLVGFAALALVLAAVGIYGLMSHAVLQRTREIGIRLAIGATPSNVLRLVVGQAARLACVGVAIGLAGALALTRVMQSLLFDVSPLDPFALGGAALLLLGVAGLSSYVPARRASRVDPKTAIAAQ
ncbi:MAG: permease [Candidatus Rokuibacteriota bacterium]|nr:MAG: permease [Candidatus Rokubacteria bacterium]